MAPPRPDLGRIRRVLDLVLRHGSGQLLARAGLIREVRNARRFTEDLESLGATYVKLGQVLATRPDLLPGDYIEALRRLHDRVEPLPWPIVRQTLAESWGEPPEDVLAEVDPTPVGAASIGQVHRAVLHGGREVALKIQRPGVRELVQSDLSSMDRLARVVDAHTGIGKRVHFRDVLETFRRTLLLELDYRVEAQNLRAIQEAIRGFPRLGVPSPVERWTTERVLVMDFVHGRRLGPEVVPTIDEPAELALVLCEAYLKQILVDGVFHADPHPGNLMVGDDGRLHLIDLGMVERLDPRVQHLVAQLLLAVTASAGHRAAEILMSMTTATENAEPAQFRRRISNVVKASRATEGVRFGMGATIIDMVQACTENGFRPPPELAVLGKTLAHLDDVGSILDPRLDPAAVVASEALHLVTDQAAHQLERTRVLERTLELAELADRAPARLGALLDQMVDGELTVKVDALDEREVLRHLQRIGNRVSAGIVTAGMLLSAAWLMDVQSKATWLGYPIMAMAFLAIAVVLALALVLSVLWYDVLRGP